MSTKKKLFARLQHYNYASIPPSWELAYFLKSKEMWTHLTLSANTKQIRAWVIFGNSFWHVKFIEGDMWAQSWLDQSMYAIFYTVWWSMFFKTHSYIYVLQVLSEGIAFISGWKKSNRVKSTVQRKSRQRNTFSMILFILIDGIFDFQRRLHLLSTQIPSLTIS